MREAILAIKIAQTQSKDTVLCNYMNTIYLGRGAYGIQAAAKAYYNKDAKDLTVSEAAMLAGIIPAPSTWDPAISPKQATSRFNRVIRIMKEDGYITAAQAQEAAMPQTVVTQTTENTYQGYKGYLLTMVEQELVNSKAFTKDELETGGYKIVTTFDQNTQNQMQSVGDNRASGMPEGMQMMQALVQNGVETRMVIFRGENHELSRSGKPKHRVRRLKEITEWFEKHTKDNG